MLLWNWQMQAWEEGEAGGLVVPIDATLNKAGLMRRFGESIYGPQPETNPIIEGTTYFGAHGENGNWDAFNDCLWNAPEAAGQEILVLHHALPGLSGRDLAIYFDILKNASPRERRPLRLRVGAVSGKVAAEVGEWLVKPDLN